MALVVEPIEYSDELKKRYRQFVWGGVYDVYNRCPKLNLRKIDETNLLPTIAIFERQDGQLIYYLVYDLNKPERNKPRRLKHIKFRKRRRW